MSTRFVIAILLAVTASPINSGRVVGEDWGIVLDSKRIPFNQLMGNPVAVRQYLNIPD